MSGGMSRIIEEGSLIETGQRVSILECRLHAYLGQVQRLAVTPVEGSNTKGYRDLQRSRDPQPGATPSAALVMGILSAGQANAVSRVGRVVDSRVADRAADSGAAGKAVDSEGRITVTVFMNSVCVIKG
jgi:hypothetical protein